MIRKSIAVIVGIVAAVLTSMAFERLQRSLYPLPEGIEKGDHQAMTDYANSLPAEALWIMLGGWALASFICGVLIKLITREKDITPPFLAGLFLLCVGIVDVYLLPHPMWFIITGVLLFIPFTLLGHATIKSK